uniref:Uncharacterized protein n=1 Tax=Kalanchoe fedtschenkoi TaxID=63787 RepID=A0A7N0SZP1_KALFE
MVLINNSHLNLLDDMELSHLVNLIASNSNVDLNQDADEDQNNNSSDEHERPNGRKGPWSPEEDSCLKDFVTRNGVGRWGLIAGELDRTSKSCRLRWCNQLSPDIYHGPFTRKEDEIIISMYEERGSKWSQIAKALERRTDNQVKNRWNSNLSKVHRRSQKKVKSAKGSRANPIRGNSKGSRRPASFKSASTRPAPTLVSISTAGPFADQVSPAASLKISEARQFPGSRYRDPASLYLPPAPAAYPDNSAPFACVEAYLPPAFVTPAAHFASQVHQPANPSPSPAPAFNHLTSLSLFPPGHETDDVNYLNQFPDHPAPLENWTGLMEEIIGVDMEQANGAGRKHTK